MGVDGGRVVKGEDFFVSKAYRVVSIRYNIIACTCMCGTKATLDQVIDMYIQRVSV